MRPATAAASPHTVIGHHVGQQTFAQAAIGNPHAPPAIDCYQVTRLDALIRRVIDSQLSGRRIEPGEQEVIRTVGQPDNGRCIIPPDFGNG